MLAEEVSRAGWLTTSSKSSRFFQARCYCVSWGHEKQKEWLARSIRPQLAIKGEQNSGLAIKARGMSKAQCGFPRASSRPADESRTHAAALEGEALQGRRRSLGPLQAWIAQGAKAPADEQPERDPRDHWAFKTPKRPMVPTVENENRGWVQNPIDAFVAVEQQKRGLTAQQPADKRVWLRRSHSISSASCHPREELRCVRRG